MTGNTSVHNFKNQCRKLISERRVSQNVISDQKCSKYDELPIWMFILHVCMLLCMYLSIYLCMYVCMYVCMCWGPVYPICTGAAECKAPLSHPLPGLGFSQGLHLPHPIGGLCKICICHLGAHICVHVVTMLESPAPICASRQSNSQ